MLTVGILLLNGFLIGSAAIGQQPAEQDEPTPSAERQENTETQQRPSLSLQKFLNARSKRGVTGPTSPAESFAPLHDSSTQQIPAAEPPTADAQKLPTAKTPSTEKELATVKAVTVDVPSKESRALLSRIRAIEDSWKRTTIKRPLKRPSGHAIRPVVFEDDSAAPASRLIVPERLASETDDSDLFAGDFSTEAKVLPAADSVGRVVLDEVPSTQSLPLPTLPSPDLPSPDLSAPVAPPQPDDLQTLPDSPATPNTTPASITYAQRPNRVVSKNSADHDSKLLQGLNEVSTQYVVKNNYVSDKIITSLDPSVRAYDATDDYDMPVAIAAGPAMKAQERTSSELFSTRLTDIHPTLNYAWGDRDPSTLPADFHDRMDHGEYVAAEPPKTVLQWAPTNLWHYPLYFEDPALERYGHAYHPVVQPFASSGRFIGQLAGLPYQMTLHPIKAHEYTLGWYRPGEWAPKKHYQIPFNQEATTAETLSIVALFFILP